MRLENFLEPIADNVFELLLAHVSRSVVCARAAIPAGIIAELDQHGLRDRHTPSTELLSTRLATTKLIT
jgi:hypothetical protein